MTTTFVLALPDEPLPVRLMNTIWADRGGVHDTLRTEEDLGRWLTEVSDGELGAELDETVHEPIGARDVDRFRGLRDALRRLAALVTEDSRPAAASATEDIDHAVAEVNRAVEQAPAWPHLDLADGRLRRRPAGTATTAARSLSAIAAQAVDLFTGEDQARLRACYAPGCVLYFVKDHPRREWCSTVCGNRARAARHYQRHRTTRA